MNGYDIGSSCVAAIQNGNVQERGVRERKPCLG